jgi:hypothetical protein
VVEHTALEEAALLWAAGLRTDQIAQALVRMKRLKGVENPEAWVYNRLNRIKVLTVENDGGEAVTCAVIVGESLI